MAEDGRGGAAGLSRPLPLVPEALGEPARLALFWRARHLAPSPALPHLPILFWLVDALRPARVLSLGLGDGVALRAVAQALERRDAPASCLVLLADGEPPRPEVEEAHPGLVTLRPGPIAEAAAALAPGSVGLLLVAAPLEGTVAEALSRALDGAMGEGGVVVIPGLSALAGSARGAAALAALRAAHPCVTLEGDGGLLLALAGASPPEPLRRLAALDPAGPALAELRGALARLGAAHVMECRLQGAGDAALLRDRVAELEGQLAARFREIAALTVALLEATGGRASPGPVERRAGLPAQRELARRLDEAGRRLRADLASPLGFRARRRVALDAAAVASSDLWSEADYVADTPEAARHPRGPVHHFVTVGTFEGRDPSPRFGTLEYYEANPDVLGVGACALAHYLRFGRAEGRALAPA